MIFVIDQRRDIASSTGSGQFTECPKRGFFMTRFLAFVFLLLAAVLPVLAQDANPPEGTPSIAGTVLGEPGSHPLKKVMVEVVAEDQKQGGNYSAATDVDGHFRIESITPGRYRVFFEKSGFMEVNVRGQKADVNVVAVRAGQSLEDLAFHMLPTAVVTGRVTDEDGDPMPSVRVEVWRKIPGKEKRESAGAVATDDKGEYRLAGLFPAQYWIAAIPSADFRDYEQHHEKAEAGDSPPETRYLTTYYPGTYDAAKASPIALKAGDELPVDFMLVPARTYHIRGAVSGMPAGPRVDVELIPKLGYDMRGAHVSPDGTFEVRGAAPGTYTLKATATSESTVLMARTDVTVAGADVDGIRLVPMPAFALSGHLRVEDQPTADVSQYAVNLRQADLPDDSGSFISEESFGENATVDHQGNFSWKNVNPGSYVVRIFGGNGQENFFLKSARIGERSADAGFSVSGPMFLDLVASLKGSTVEGLVTDHDSQGNNVPISNVSVVAVPEEKYRKIPEHFGTGATDQYGRFTIRGLAPGAYTLFAWQDAEEDLFHDPDFLRSQQSNGTPVKVEEGSRQKVDLKLSAIGDDWR